ncbi:hypothetical protein PAMA_003626 [Pampus argenteus]
MEKLNHHHRRPFPVLTVLPDYYERCTKDHPLVRVFSLFIVAHVNSHTAEVRECTTYVPLSSSQTSGEATAVYEEKDEDEYQPVIGEDDDEEEEEEDAGESDEAELEAEREQQSRRALWARTDLFTPVLPELPDDQDDPKIHNSGVQSSTFHST